MKKTTALITGSMLLALAMIGRAESSKATSGATFWDRLQAQVSDINPQFPGSNAVGDSERITPSIASDKTRFNPNRMIRITQYEGNYLVGLSDPTVVSQLLGDKVKPVIQDFGNGIKGVPTYIMSTEDVGFVGCSCPPHFEEFSVNVIVQDPGLDDSSTFSPATVHIATLYWTTDHLKRQETMVHKFSLSEQFAGIPIVSSSPPHIGFVQSPEGVSGIYLKNQRGRTVFKASRKNSVIPPAKTIVPFMDLIIYSMNEQNFSFHGDSTLDLFNLHGAHLPGQFFRIQETNHAMAFDPTQAPPIAAFFSPKTDSLFVDPHSDIGALLGKIKYQPLFWTSETMNQAMAWTPKPL